MRRPSQRASKLVPDIVPPFASEHALDCLAVRVVAQNVKAERQ
jgi:hypothetical protein